MSSEDTYFNLGDWHRDITTSSEKAQTWFDRGLNWVYGFNHEEARRCFERSTSYGGSSVHGKALLGEN